MHYIRAHWRGELSLAHSYWINMVLPRVVFGVALVMLAATEIATRPSLSLVALLALNVIVIVGISIWQIVGVWRSATQHKQRTGYRFWGTAAQVMVVFGCLTVATMTLQNGQAALVSIRAMNGQLYAEYNAEVVDTDIHLTGFINYDGVDEIRDFLSSNESVNALVINSPGGFVGAAKELGSLVEQNELIVLANGQCLSACTLALVASPAPAIVPGTIVGFHRAGGLGDAELDAESARMMDEFYNTHGVSSDVRTKVMSIPYKEMWTPSLQELVEHGIIKYVFDSKAWQFVDAGEWCAARPSDCSPPKTAL